MSKFQDNGASDCVAEIPRRDALASLGVAAAGVALAGCAWPGVAAAAQDRKQSPVSPAAQPVSPESLGWDPKARQYVLPQLPYKYEDLEPHIDRQTMELHHSKHHQAYVTGMNNALKNLAEVREGKRDGAEVRRWSQELAFHGSGHLLHVLFWKAMKPASSGGGGQPREGTKLAEQIARDFGSFRKFSDHFQTAANNVEGNGWAILALETISGQLMILQAQNHQNLTIWGVVPLLPIDVWEHAYYLKHQNNRKEYVSAFMNVINWESIDRHYVAVQPAVHHG